MYLDIIVQHAQDIVDVGLPWLRLFTDPLKLNQQRPAAWNKEKTIGPTVVALQIQFDRDYPHLFEGDPANLILSILL